MRLLGAMSLAALGLGAFAGAAPADIPPPPGAQEGYFLRLIESSGHGCGEIRSFSPGTEGAADLDQPGRGLDPYVVRCANGRTYLVAVPQRHIGPWPDAPKPVVKEIKEKKQ